MDIKTIFKTARRTLQAHVQARLGAVIVAASMTFMVAAWTGAVTYGKGFAQSTAILLVKPVTDSLKARQERTEAAMVAVQDSIRSVKEAQDQAKLLNEKIIAAQRQSDPRFDQALKEMARAGEIETQKEIENRELLKRLAQKSKTR